MVGLNNLKPKIPLHKLEQQTDTKVGVIWAWHTTRVSEAQSFGWWGTLCTLHWQGIISVVNRGESKSLGSTKYVVTTTTHSPMCEEGKICPSNQTIQKTHFPIQRLHYSPTRIRLSRETHFQNSAGLQLSPKNKHHKCNISLSFRFYNYICHFSWNLFSNM